jgi:hypothetical protein
MGLQAQGLDRAAQSRTSSRLFQMHRDSGGQKGLGEKIRRSRVGDDGGLEMRETFGERANVGKDRGTWNLEKNRGCFGKGTRGRIPKRNVVSRG